MNFHWQNLNDDKTRPRWGGGARHGRAWWDFGSEPYRGDGVNARLEWSFFDRHGGGASFAAQRQDGTGIQLHVGIPCLFSFYLGLRGGIWARLARRLLPTKKRNHAGQFETDYNDYEINVYWFEWALWWRFWTPTMEWSNRTPKWRHGSFHPADFFFGRTKVTDREIAREDVLIPMPERAYKATVVIEDRVWRRPRWPFPWHHHVGAHVHMEQDPVPHPGKGESDYDCGEDATYSSSFPIPKDRFSDAVSYAIGQVVASAIAQRARYGGRDWLPKEDHRPKSGVTSPA